MLFSCNLDVPRTADSTGMPTAWIRDTAILFAGIGFLSELITHVPIGTIVDADVMGTTHPADPPMGEIVSLLLDARYLRPIHADGEEEHYEIVHPERLGAFPGQAYGETP